jgi:hypothetical protein
VRIRDLSCCKVYVSDILAAEENAPTLRNSDVHFYFLAIFTFTLCFFEQKSEQVKRGSKLPILRENVEL